jgi:hypothetical protein
MMQTPVGYSREGRFACSTPVFEPRSVLDRPGGQGLPMTNRDGISAIKFGSFSLGDVFE